MSVKIKPLAQSEIMQVWKLASEEGTSRARLVTQRGNDDVCSDAVPSDTVDMILNEANL